jgi:hypothetical protein
MRKAIAALALASALFLNGSTASWGHGEAPRRPGR